MRHSDGHTLFQKKKKIDARIYQTNVWIVTLEYPPNSPLVGKQLVKKFCHNALAHKSDIKKRLLGVVYIGCRAVYIPPTPPIKILSAFLYKVLYSHVITNMNTMRRSASTQHALAVGTGTRCTCKNNDTNKMSTSNKMNISYAGNLLTSAFKLFIHSEGRKQESMQYKEYLKHVSSRIVFLESMNHTNWLSI